MKLLAFDLSTYKGSIALAKTDTANAEPALRLPVPQSLLERREWPNDRRSSAPFFRALAETIRAHGCPDVIVVGLGPGSYTGTRIAISAAIGLQVTSGARLLGLPSIGAMSAEEDYAVVGDAKRASFFFARITEARLVGELELLSGNEMTKRISEATVPIYSADELSQFDRVQLAFPRADLLCRFAQTSENLVHAPLEPIYLRAPHITMPRLART